MNEIEPGDRGRATDSLVAVDVDNVLRGGKSLINDGDRIPHKLGRHETGISNIDVVGCDVGFGK